MIAVLYGDAYPVFGHEHSNICRVQNVANIALEICELVKPCSGIISLAIHDINLFRAEQLKLDMTKAGLDECIIGSSNMRINDSLYIIKLLLKFGCVVNHNSDGCCRLSI